MVIRCRLHVFFNFREIQKGVCINKFRNKLCKRPLYKALDKFSSNTAISSKHTVVNLLCPRLSKNGGGALSVSPVRAFVRPSVRASVRYLVFAQ